MKAYGSRTDDSSFVNHFPYLGYNLISDVSKCQDRETNLLTQDPEAPSHCGCLLPRHPLHSGPSPARPLLVTEERGQCDPG